MKKILVALIIAIVLLNLQLSESQNCPGETTASYRFITFVGKAGLGGDNSVDVWFEYGVNKDNLKSTQKLTLKQDGIYCLRVTKLKPCTTYYYRAVAKNSAGVNYGELKSIKTLCSAINFNSINNSQNSNSKINNKKWIIF